MKIKSYEGDEPFIFISYAHRDMEKVMPIVERLNNDGYRVWYDEGIAPIETWDDFIAQKVKNCEIMLALISDNYINSDNCMDELSYARDCKKKILRVYVDKNVELPDGAQMRLNRIQAVFRTDFDNEDEFFSKLYLAKDISVCRKNPGENETASAKPEQYIDPDMTTKNYTGGEVYYGQLTNNLRNGYGKMTYADGSVYEGEWKDNKRNGRGIMTYPDGKVEEGEWKDDVKKFSLFGGKKPEK